MPARQSLQANRVSSLSVVNFLPQIPQKGGQARFNKPVSPSLAKVARFVFIALPYIKYHTSVILTIVFLYYNIVIMKKAMTLVEVVISMVILGLIAAGICATFVMVGKGGTSDVGTFQLQAVNYARETLETLKNAVSTESGHNNPLTPGTHDDPLPPGDFKSRSGTRTYVVEDVDANSDGITDYKRVTVSVKWTD